MLEWVASQLTSAILAELEGGRPELVLLRRKESLLERQDLVGPLDGGNMREERTDGVALRVMEVIEFGDRQTLDRGERGGPRVRQHADQSSDRRRITCDRLDS